MAPSKNGFGGMPIYVGSRRRQIGSGGIYSGNVRRQVGGNIFGFLKRMLIPLAKRLFATAKPHLKTLGKKVGKQALNIGSHAVGDLMSGNIQNIPATLRKQSKAGLNELSEDYIGQKIFTNQDGSGRRKRKPAHIDPHEVAKKKRKTAAIKPINKTKKKKKTHIQISRDIFTK